MRIVLLLYCFLMSGCCGPSDAERRTCRVVGAEYLRYVDADPALSAEQKQDRVDLVQSWRMRVNR